MNQTETELWIIVSAAVSLFGASFAGFLCLYKFFFKEHEIKSHHERLVLLFSIVSKTPWIEQIQRGIDFILRIMDKIYGKVQHSESPKLWDFFTKRSWQANISIVIFYTTGVPLLIFYYLAPWQHLRERLENITGEISSVYSNIFLVIYLMIQSVILLILIKTCMKITKKIKRLLGLEQRRQSVVLFKDALTKATYVWCTLAAFLTVCVALITVYGASDWLHFYIVFLALLIVISFFCILFYSIWRHGLEFLVFLIAFFLAGVPITLVPVLVFYMFHVILSINWPLSCMLTAIFSFFVLGTLMYKKTRNTIKIIFTSVICAFCVLLLGDMIWHAFDQGAVPPVYYHLASFFVFITLVALFFLANSISDMTSVGFSRFYWTKLKHSHNFLSVFGVLASDMMVGVLCFCLTWSILLGGLLVLNIFVQLFYSDLAGNQGGLVKTLVDGSELLQQIPEIIGPPNPSNEWIWLLIAFVFVFNISTIFPTLAHIVSVVVFLTAKLMAILVGPVAIKLHELLTDHQEDSSKISYSGRQRAVHLIAFVLTLCSAAALFLFS